MVEDGAFSHKKKTMLQFFLEILNLEGHPNRTTGSRVLLNGWILPIGGALAVEVLLSMGPTPSSFKQGRTNSFNMYPIINKMYGQWHNPSQYAVISTLHTILALIMALPYHMTHCYKHLHFSSLGTS